MTLHGFPTLLIPGVMARRMACALAFAAVSVPALAAAQTTADSIATVDVTQLPGAPDIVNRDEVAQLMSRTWSRLSGAEGVVVLALVIDERGTPHDVAVSEPSGNAAMDSGAAEVMRRMRFAPQTLEGRPVRVRLRMPLTFGGAPIAAVDTPAAPGAGQGYAVASAVDTADVYEARQLTAQPKLANGGEVARATLRNYPTLLYDAGINGLVRLEAVIGRDGRVTHTRVLYETHEAFGRAAERVARVMRFTPGQVGGVPVRTRLVLPVVFER